MAQYYYITYFKKKYNPKMYLIQKRMKNPPALVDIH
jgi:hypothetical protein